MEFAIFVLILFGLWIHQLGGKIGALQKDVERLKSGSMTRTAEQRETVSADTRAVNVSPVVSDMGMQNGVPQSISPELLKQYEPHVSGESAGDHAIEWIKKDFMVKLGAFLLLLALGWFVSYAIENEWIGPMGQILLGLCASAVFMILGVWRIQTHAHQGGIFTVMGSTGVLLTMWAAREIYGLFDQYSALFIMALSVVFVAFMSVRYNRNALALAGLVLASIAPLFTAAPTPDVFGLFVYLTIIVCGTLWVVYLRGWSNLTLAALIVVFLHGLPYLLLGLDSGDKDIALLFAFFFTAVFFIANIIGLIVNENDQNRHAHIVIGVGTGLYLILWIAGAAGEEWQSLLYAMWMMVFSTGSFIVYRALNTRVPFYIYGGTSIALLAAATAAELSGQVLTIAYTIEVSILVLLIAYVLRDVRAASKLSVLFVGPILLSFESLLYSYTWDAGVFHDDFFVVFVLGTALFVVGCFLYELRDTTASGDNASVGTALMVFGALYGLALIWLVLHAGSGIYGNQYSQLGQAAYERGTTLALIVYTLIGLALYIGGMRGGKKALALGGQILLGFVVARLLFVEVWNMELMGRITTFVVIGLLLISTAFVRKQRVSPTVLENKNTTI